MEDERPGAQCVTSAGSLAASRRQSIRVSHASRCKPLIWAAVSLLSAVGCTHAQLRRSTLHQARAVHEVHQQQVLDNLALFVDNPNAVPFFTVVGAGTCSISDQGSASGSLGFVRSGFDSLGLMLGGSRLAQENFTLAPVTNPDKLARMRCAYQAAVGAGGSHCINCCGLEQEWGKKNWTGRPAAAICPDECLPTPGWFAAGCRGEVPKEACYVGRHHDKYVWVLPDGHDTFARLTLMVLDYATGVPGPVPLETIKTIDTSGKLTVERTWQQPLGSGLPIALGHPTTARPGDQAGSLMPVQPERSPVRQDYFFPSPLPQVVVPLRAF